MWKAHSIFIIESGMLDESYKKHQKILKELWGINMHHRNEIDRFFLENKKLHKKCKEFLRLWTKVEPMGYSEGKVEEDVN